MEDFINRLASGPDAGTRMYIFMKSVYSVEEIRRDKPKPVYHPAEISMAAFNLMDGLISIYTTLVDTRKKD